MENLQIRCSSLYKIMGKPQKKTKAQIYADSVSSLDKKKAAYNKMKNKDTDTAVKNLEDQVKLTKIIKELKPLKDTWELSETAKTWIKQKAKEFFYGYEKKVETRYMDKGHNNEDEAIEMLSELHGKQYKKNVKRISLTWLTGECDIINEEEKIIIDIKNAWDIDTFPAYKEDVNKKVKEAGYDWQQKGYLILYKCNVAYVAYCITDTPEELVPDWEDLTLHQVSHHNPRKRVTVSDEIRITEEEVLNVKKAYKAANKFYKECLTELINK